MVPVDRLPSADESLRGDPGRDERGDGGRGRRLDRSVRLRRAAWGLSTLLTVAACQGPPVDVRAVWMDESRDRIHVYDSGQFEDIVASPQPFPGEAHARVHLGPGGRYLLVRDGPSSPRLGRAHDLVQRRSFAVSLPELLPGGQERVQFTAAGDALAFVEEVCIEGDCSAPRLFVSPLQAGLEVDDEGGRQSLLFAGPIDANSQVFSAADAPIIYTVGPGELAAFRYPDAAGAPRELETLAHIMVPDLPVPALVEDCPFSNWCGRRMAVEPGGASMVFASADEGCASGFKRWKPGGEPICLELPEAVEDARLLAALSPDRLVFVDDTRLHLVQTDTAESRALPILGQGDYFFRVANHGRALLFASYDGPVLRAEPEGLTLVSNATTECQDPEAPVWASDGSWLAWRCGRAPDVQLGEDFAAALVRVTDTSLRRYPGVASWPLAIDTDGDLLFITTSGASESIPDNEFKPEDDGFSGGVGDAGQDEETGGFDWGEGDWGADGDGGDGFDDLLDPFSGGSIERLTPKPLTLYSLTAEGVIRRISDLEPTPVPLKRIETGVSRYLQAE